MQEPTAAEMAKAVLKRAVESFPNRQQKGIGHWLAERGYYGNNGQEYSPSAVSGWKNGRNLPPLDVFIELVRYADLRLDPLLYPPAPAPARVAQPEDPARIERLEGRIEELEQLVQRLLPPAPEEETNGARVPQTE
jgi:hypothetical protein